MSSVTIYHNPACGTSRNALAMIREAGHEPEVIEYLEVGWTLSRLRELIESMGVEARDLLRTRGTPAEELGLLDPALDQERLLAAMVEHPILVNRPIVVTPRGARLARPAETVYEIL